MVPGYKNAFHFDKTQEAFSIQFESFGYESINMIQNMGMSFVQLLLIIVWLLSILIINFLITYLRLKAQWIRRKEKQAFYNTMIIILQEGALNFFLGSFINLLNYDFKSSRTEIFSTSFAIFIQACTLVMIICSFSITMKIIKEKQGPSYQERVAIIYEGLSQKNLWTINYHNLTVLRKIYLAALLVFLKEWPLLQILAFYIQSIVFLLYLVLKKPMEDRKQWKMELANEIAILMAALSLPAFTSQVDSDRQYFYGWYLCGILIFAIGANTLYNLILQLIEIKETMKRLCNYVQDKLNNRKKIAQQDEEKVKVYAIEQLPRPIQPFNTNKKSNNQFELEVQDI